MKNCYRALLVFLIGFTFVLSADAGVRYVKPGSSSSAWEGKSPLYSSITEAISAAQPGDEIWVAEGVYKPTGSTDRSISFVLKEGVALYGGFKGNESSREERDPYTNETILSGNIGDQSSSGDNSHSVVKADGTSSLITEATVLDGFIIEDGKTLTPDVGAGLHLVKASPRVVNVWFRRNNAAMGGGVYGDASSDAVFANVIFSDNSSSSAGAGVYARGAMKFYHCLWYNNVNTVEYSTASLSDKSSIYNSIIWGNAEQSGKPVVVAASVSYSIVQGGYEGTGNLDTDPLLHNPGASDFRLNDGSPAINAGSNGLVPTWLISDFAGNSRVEGTVDMGPFEGSVKAPVAKLPLAGSAFEASQTTFTLEWEWPLGAPAGIVSYEVDYKLNDVSQPSISGISGLNTNVIISASGAIAWRVAAIDDTGIKSWSEWSIFYKKRSGPVYIKVNGMGSGKAWNDATNLQAALQNYIAGDELWLQTGTYRPGSSRSASFVLKEGIKIYGGFFGNETTREERDWNSNKTILSGNIGLPDSKTDNSRNVLVAVGTAENPITAATIVDGVIIEQGYNTETTSNGAGIKLSYASVSFANVWFRDNYAYNGGAVSGDAYSKPTFFNSIFSSNSSMRYGGAVWANDHMEFTNCVFYGNSTNDRGGAIDNAASKTFVNVNNSIAWANTSGSNPNFYAIQAKNCLVEGGYPGIEIILNNPLFLNAEGNDFRLNATSPAIDAGNSSLLPEGALTDFSGAPRIQGTRVDMGVFEGGIVAPSLASPANNEVISPIPDEVELRWQWPGDTPANVLSYIVEYSVNDASVTTIKDIDKELLSQTISGFNAADMVKWRVAAVTGLVEKHYSPWSVFHIVRGEPIYVKSGASGSGTSWADAADLQSALQMAGFGDELWLAAGVYKPTATSDRTISFVVADGIKLYGGFSGSETSLDERNRMLNETVLSGNIGDQSDASDNSYHIITIEGEISSPVSSSTIIDGLIIEGGYASFAFNGDDLGGGIYLNHASPVITNIVFRDNYATNGAAAYITGNSNPRFGNVIFVNNESLKNGGAVNIFGASAEMYNCLWYANYAAQWGGAVYGDTGNGTTIYNSVFWNNEALLLSDNFRNVAVNSSIVEDGTGNAGISGNPLFVDPEMFDFRLGLASPGIDAGVAAPEWLLTDFKGEDRKQGEKTDIGPFEGAVNTVRVLSPANGAAVDPDGGRVTLEWDWYQTEPADLSYYKLFYSINGAAAVEADNIADKQYTIEGLQSFDEIEWQLCSYHSDGSRRFGPVSRFKVTRGHPLFVSPSGSGEGSSWADASSLHDALFMAVETDVLWLSAGTYYPSDGSDRDASFSITSDGIKVYGGFAGTETELSQRDWLTNLTVLSGDIGLISDFSDNSYKVLSVLGSAENTIDKLLIDGLVIEGGNSNSNGGGMSIEYASPVIVNTRFSNNRAASQGGAVWSDAASMPEFANTIFADNSSSSTGGAVHALGTAAFYNCLWYNNNATYYGGGLFATKARVQNSIAWGNSASGSSNIHGASVDFSIVEGGYPGAGNLNSAPSFADAANGDFRLLKGSPAVNMGNNDYVPEWLIIDFKASDRIVASIVDMGPMEGYLDVDLEAPIALSPISGTVFDSEIISVDVQWEWAGDEPEGISGYEMEYRINVDDFQLISSIVSKNQIIVNLEPGDVVRWRVRAKTGSISLDWSEFYSFSIEPPTSLPGMDAKNPEIAVWPNPLSAANPKINIKLAEYVSDLDIKLYSLSGSLIGVWSSLTGNEFHVDPGNLNSGVYMLVIESDEAGRWMQKLLVKP